MFFRCITPDMATILRSDFMKSLPDGAYMAGGTAAALYFGHRISVDIDLFTPASFDSFQMFAFLNDHFKNHFRIDAAKVEKDTLVVNLNQTGFSLFSYPYRLLEAPLTVDAVSVPLASVVDLALMKLIAINQRGSCKDFIDFKTIAENKDFALDDLVPRLLQKYPLGEKIVFQLKKSLVYFDDAEKDLNINMYHERSGTFAALDQETWLATKQFFIEYVAKGQLAGSIL